jgi:hypothetical protein
MAVLASRLLAPPSLARSQRELASDAQSVGRKGSSPRTLGGSPSLSLSLHGTGLTTVVLVPVVPPSTAPFEAV